MLYAATHRIYGRFTYETPPFRQYMTGAGKTGRRTRRRETLGPPIWKYLLRPKSVQ